MPKSPASAPDLAAHVVRICESQRFRKAPALRELLVFLDAHRDNAEMSEYAIGVDALGRKANFDPRTDATVRVQVARLRQRLKEYYENEGKDDEVRITIPLGGYRPEIERVAATTRPPWRPHYLHVAVALLAILCLGLLLDRWRLRRAGSPTTKPVIHDFWSAFKQDGMVNIVVPAPLFFIWKDSHLVARDFSVNDPSLLLRSSPLAVLQKQLGQPEVSQLYTVASDTLAAGTIARYLQDREVGVNLVDTPTVSVETLGNRNTVLLIGPGTIDDAQPLLRNMSFTIPQGSASVVNRKPKPGEPEVWKDSQLAPFRIAGHGIIARLPGRGTGTEIVLLASRYNLSLASILTASAELDALTQINRANGSPRFFEIVVRYERNNDRTLRAKPIAFHSVSH